MDLYLMDREGGHQRRIVAAPVFDGVPVFSPDGREIVFFGNRDGRERLYRMPTPGAGRDGASPSGLPPAPSGNDETPSVSPDGLRIAFVSDRGGKRDLYLCDRDGGNARRLTDGLGVRSQPSWSPDGRRLAFSAEQRGRFELYVIGVDGTGLQRLTSAADGFRPDPG